MIKTVPQIINEIMFIATAKPDGLDVTVEYRSISDCVVVRVMPIGFNYNGATTESYSAAMLLCTDVFLDYPNALKELLTVKERLLQLMTVKTEIAA